MAEKTGLSLTVFPPIAYTRCSCLTN